VIAKASGIRTSPNHCQSEENHTSANLQRSAESEVNAAGIKCFIAREIFGYLCGATIVEFAPEKRLTNMGASTRPWKAALER
jgi:hypothetical protein